MYLPKFFGYLKIEQAALLVEQTTPLVAGVAHRQSHRERLSVSDPAQQMPLNMTKYSCLHLVVQQIKIWKRSLLTLFLLLNGAPFKYGHLRIRKRLVNQAVDFWLKTDLKHHLNTQISLHNL